MYKKIIAIALLLIVNFGFVDLALAGNAANGSRIFRNYCAACHEGGNNIVNSSKNLKKDALKKYKMYSLDKIKYQVINGKNAMPAFSGKLTEAQIEDVATYVLSQADGGW